MYGIKVNTAIFGKTEEIVTNALMFYTKNEPLMNSLKNIHDACKVLYTRQWMFVQETGKDLKDQPFLKDFYKKTGCALPGDCFACLWACVVHKIKLQAGDIEEGCFKPCDFCSVQAMECDNERGLYRMFITSNRHNKRHLAGVIKNLW